MERYIPQPREEMPETPEGIFFGQQVDELGTTAAMVTAHLRRVRQVKRSGYQREVNRAHNLSQVEIDEVFTTTVHETVLDLDNIS